MDFNNECPNEDLRIITHSLGPRVILSAIQSLYDCNSHDGVSKIVTSVHLLGAAVDNEQVSINNPDECNVVNTLPLNWPGNTISLAVMRFYNLDNPEYNMLAPQKSCLFCFRPLCLESPYFSDSDNPQEVHLIENTMDVPFNYDEYSVRDAIGLDGDTNGDGECDLMLRTSYTIILFNGEIIVIHRWPKN